jgi:D-methionine transport system ATP-binding protein
MINKNLKLTIILITHKMEVIKQICNKVAVIENGAIVEEGWVSEVFSNPEHAITKQFVGENYGC